MADGLELKRIVDLVAQTDIDEGVYTIIDSVSGAVKKYPLGSFICSVAPIFDAAAAYAAGAYCNYNGQLYQFDEAHAAGAWTGEDATAVTLSQILGENGEDISDLQSDVSSLQTDMAGKADANGNYPNMTVGNADQLVSSVKIEDQVPYIFRTSGGSVDIGDRETDELVGGSLVWNQLMPNPSDWLVQAGSPTLVTDDTGGTLTVTGTDITAYDPAIRGTGSVNVSVVGHKYLIDFEFCAPDNASNEDPVVYLSSTAFSTDSAIGASKTGWNKYSRIKSATNIGVIISYLGLSNARTVLTQGDRLQFRNVKCIDLTQMFGSTIADYIYSLETATAGAGVAWFKKLFPKDYYAYNAGEILSVSGVSAHQMTGFNQWDEEWEVGSIDPNTGGNKVANNTIRSKNYIRVIPNTTYYIHANNMLVFFYDADKNLITYRYKTNTTDTTPVNCYYIRFNMDVPYGTTYNHDICINLHWDGERDGEYEPYELHSYPLDDSLTLRGIQKLDANNNLYYDGDTYESDGTVTRRYGIVDLGTLTWEKQVASFTTSSINSVIKKASSNADIVYLVIEGEPYNLKSVNSDSGVAGSYDLFVNTNGNITWRYPLDNIADGAAFATLMNGVHMLYPLATPTTESADTFQNPQIVDDWGTEEYVTTSIVPVGHNTEYSPNLRAKLEMAPNSPDGDGDYIVRQTDGENEYVELVIPSELPAAPTTDGNYKLRVSVSSGTATYSWVADS